MGFSHGRTSLRFHFKVFIPSVSRIERVSLSRGLWVIYQRKMRPWRSGSASLSAISTQHSPTLACLLSSQLYAVQRFPIVSVFPSGQAIPHSGIFIVWLYCSKLDSRSWIFFCAEQRSAPEFYFLCIAPTPKTLHVVPVCLCWLSLPQWCVCAYLKVTFIMSISEPLCTNWMKATLCCPRSFHSQSNERTFDSRLALYLIA